MDRESRVVTIPAENARFVLRTTWQDGRSVVALEGAVDVSAAHELSQALGRAVGRGGSELVVDLTAAELIDSAALGSLVLVQKQARRLGGDLVLVGVKGKLRRALGITGLDRAFRFAAGVTDP